MMEEDRWRQRLSNLFDAAIPVDAVGYRSTTVRYSTADDIISGEGSALNGGRWNPKGLRAVYASLTPELAMSESLAYFRYYGFPVSSAMPRVFVSISIRLSRVLDLTNGSIRQRLKTSADTLYNLDWRTEIEHGKIPITHLISRFAADVGFEAMLVHSAVERSGKNLIVFPTNLLPDSNLSVDNANGLPNT